MGRGTVRQAFLSYSLARKTMMFWAAGDLLWQISFCAIIKLVLRGNSVKGLPVFSSHISEVP